MKIVFKKDDESNISIAQKTGNKEDDYSYVDMIKHLIKNKSLKQPVLEGDFSDAEKQSIDSMVTYINEAIQAVNDEWEEE